MVPHAHFDTGRGMPHADLHAARAVSTVLHRVVDQVAYGAVEKDCVSPNPEPGLDIQLDRQPVRVSLRAEAIADLLHEAAQIDHIDLR